MTQVGATTDARSLFTNNFAAPSKRGIYWSSDSGSGIARFMMATATTLPALATTLPVRTTLRLVFTATLLLTLSLPADAQNRRGGRDAKAPLLYPPGHSEDRAGNEQQSAEEVLFEEFGHFLQRLERLEDEIAKLNGIIEEQNLLVKRLQEEQKRRYLEINRRLSGIVPPSPAGGALGDNASFNPDNDNYNYANEQEAFDDAFSEVRNQNFIAASNAFQALLIQFPDGSKVADALFWLGEIYLALPQPRVEESRSAFSELVERFPEHKRVPDALYKLGNIHDQLGDKNRSDHYMNLVIKDYPKSSAAKLASAYLEKPG